MSKIILNAILLILILDFIGFMFWCLSGQFPLDNFYLGVITKTVISLII